MTKYETAERMQQKWEGGGQGPGRGEGRGGQGRGVRSGRGGRGGGGQGGWKKQVKGGFVQTSGLREED